MRYLYQKNVLLRSCLFRRRNFPQSMKIFSTARKDKKEDLPGWRIALVNNSFFSTVRSGCKNRQDGVATSRTEFSAGFWWIKGGLTPASLCRSRSYPEDWGGKINEHFRKLVGMELVIRNKSPSSHSYEDTSLIPDTCLRQRMAKIIPPNINFELI